MVTIKLYSFSKEENSTKIPTGSQGTQYTGLLIEPCSVLNPVIKLEGVTAYSFNYAYISEFSRYYFITDWETDKGFWYITLKVDALGSFKSVIGSSTQYVLRAASAQNQYIVDTLYPTTGSFTKSTVEVAQGLASYLPDGTFVLNVTGSSNNGTVGSYACGWPTFKNFISNMLLMNDDDNWWENLADGLRNSIFHPFDHVGSVIWFPDGYIDLTGITAVTSITLGTIVLSSTVSKPLSFYPLNNASQWDSSTLTLPKHPQASTNGKYMNLKPYTQYIYRDAIFGDIELDPLKLIDTSTFTISKLSDPLTGLQMVFLPDGQTRVGQAGVLIPMENNSLNMGGLISSITSAISSFASGNAIDGAANVISAAGSLLPTVTSTAQQGSTILSWPYVVLDAYFWNAVGHDDTHKGKPYCQTKQISTLSGYVLTDNAHIESSSMTSTEQEMITNYMNGGFYYE